MELSRYQVGCAVTKQHASTLFVAFVMHCETTYSQLSMLRTTGNMSDIKKYREQLPRDDCCSELQSMVKSIQL